MLSTLEVAFTRVFVAGMSSCVSHATAALRANPSASRLSRATPRAFTVELPFNRPAFRQGGISCQLMLRMNFSQVAVLKPGYPGKSYRLASSVTRVAEKRLTRSKTYCERRMAK
jgi:hypothetical protein